MNMKYKVTKVKPQGYCGGVLKAIQMAKECRKLHPNESITILGNLVHNNYVKEALTLYDLKTVEDPSKTRWELLDLVESGIVIFTAHGVNQSVKEKAIKKGLTIVDASCPFVLQTQKIVEQKDASERELAINEINTGIYCFDAEALFNSLKKVNNNNAQGEYYLPDVLSILRGEKQKINATIAENYEETLGINSREQLANAEKIIRQRKNKELMAQGVTLMDPDTTYVDVDVEIGQDTIIYPSTWIEGNSKIGEGCKLGPNSHFKNTVMGDNVEAMFSFTEDCEIADDVKMGPYVHIRPNTKLAHKVKIGNFVEVKNSNIGEGSKLPHLSYIGDTDMGSGVNMGCGTITVNYDGKNKFRTIIGDDCFIGCNSNLVAPVKVNNGAYVGAGSTITKEVPENALAIARERQKNIEGWKDKRK